MNKKIIKIIVSILIIMLLISVFTLESNAGDRSTSVTKLFGGGNGLTEGREAAKDIIGSILNIVRIVGAAVALIILMTIAAKYLLASAGDRADIKKYAVNYIIGAVIMFAASGIIGIIQNITNKSIKVN